MESIKLNVEQLLNETIKQADLQNKELEILVSDETARNIIRELMAYTLTKFMFLTQDQRLLVIKFLMESIEQLEQAKKL